MAGKPEGCARTTGAVVGDAPPEGGDAPPAKEATKEERMIARVGRGAPDFDAPAYHRGAFTNVKLSDHLGKWVLLCFYPGDFTFV